MKTVAYINSFKDHEIDREIELKIQLERIKEFCHKNSHTLLTVFEEPQDSREDYRPSLIKLITAAEKGMFEAVIVLKTERLGKDDMLKNWVLGELEKNDVKVFPIVDTIDTPTEFFIEQSAKAKTIQEKVKDIPSLPEIVSKIIELVQNPNSSAKELSTIISHDAGLTSRVLRLVNSAYYGFPKQIGSIQHAVTILGFTTMRGLVLSTSIFKIFAPKSRNSNHLDYKSFWKHSLLTAIAAKHIDKYLYLRLDEDVFSSGILHDIGKLILDQYDHQNYVKAFNETPNPILFDEILESEQKYCSVTHSFIGSIVADGWNLPRSLSDVIKYHHSPMESEEHKLIACVINVANTLSHFIMAEQSPELDFFDEEVLNELGISEDDIFKITEIITEEVSDINELENFFK